MNTTSGLRARRFPRSSSFLLSALVLVGSSSSSPAAEAGFIPAFNGKTLAGWHVSARTGHSGASQHKSGGRWVVEDGAIVGSQDIPGNGGATINKNCASKS